MARFNKKLIALSSLLLVSNVNAGGPGFDGIEVKGDTLIDCPTGIDGCTPLIEGEGFLQQEITLSNNSYIQTVVIDPISANAGITWQGNVIVNPFTSIDSTIISSTVVSTGPVTSIDSTQLNIPADLTASAINSFTLPAQAEHIGDFQPGGHLLTLQAPAQENERPQRWTHRLNVLPLASFGSATVLQAGEGSHVTIPVFLNGNAPSYPVKIPYSVSRNTNSSNDHSAIDGTVIFYSEKVSTISAYIKSDDITDEWLENIVFTLQPPTTNNAALGHYTSKQIAITEEHLPPQLGISVTQLDQETRSVDNYTTSDDSLQTVVSIIIRANNPSHKYLIDWGESDNNILAAMTSITGKSLYFDPTNIPTGLYKINVQIIDLLSQNEKKYTIEALINISDVTPAPATNSEEEPQYVHLFDSGASLHWPAKNVPLQFSDVTYDTLMQRRLPFTTFERIQLEDSLLLAPYQSITRKPSPLNTDIPLEVLAGEDTSRSINEFISLNYDWVTNWTSLRGSNSIRVANGLSLRGGDVIIATNQVGNHVTTADLSAHGGPNGAAALYPVDNGLIPDQIVDFEVSGLTTPGQSVSIVIPQESPIPENPIYRKYMPHAGWVTFTEDSNNRLASTNKVNGICPTPDDAAYTTGLTVGHNCIQLTIEDGGPNDADQQANTIIKDPGGVTSAVAVTTSNSVDGNSGGGGTGLSLIWLLLTLGATRLFLHKKNSESC